MGATIHWLLSQVGGKIHIVEEKSGLWSASLEMPNITTIRSATEDGAKIKALRALKKYIVCAIEDLERLEKYHKPAK
jgi:hypothetical protein